MRQFYSLLSAIMFVAFCAYGCGDDQPTGPGTGGTKDTTDTTKCDTCGTGGQDSLPKLPCGVATDTSVGTNGFFLTGSGFNATKVTLSPSGTPAERSIAFNYDDATGELIETEYTISNRVLFAPGDSGTVLMTMRVNGNATGNYRWDTDTNTGAGANTVTLEITRKGVTRVFGSKEGQTIVSSAPALVAIRGRFCGLMVEGSTGARMTITSGLFNSDQ